MPGGVFLFVWWESFFLVQFCGVVFLLFVCGQESFLLLFSNAWLREHGMERNCIWSTKIEECSRRLAVG